jgi:hypothetical protein
MINDVSIFCPYCHRYTSLTVAQKEVNTGGGRSIITKLIWERSSESHWWIGICNNCKDPVLIHNIGDTIYPHPLPSPTDVRIPEKIRHDLDEAKMCFSVDAYRACAVMARRVMQVTCIDKGSKKEKLVDQLSELATGGKITTDLKEWADVVRWVGNDAAHPGSDEVTKEDSEDILKLAEQFLNVIYVAPAIAQERRKKIGK